MFARRLIAFFAFFLVALPLEARTFADEQRGWLIAAMTLETEPDRRAAIAASLHRLEALEDIPEGRVLVVNIPAFELTLWDGDRRIDSWRVIVGKPATKTPEFRAQVEAVIINPWWNIPDSIVRESVGALVRRNPAEARRRGYVWSNGVYRQRPGPTNALGLVKLELPNPYRIGMHDTPSRQLFDEEVRAFSHGCIRIHEIDQLATTLIGGEAAEERITKLIEAGRNVRIPLDQPIPVIVGYFPAEHRDGDVIIHADIYGRQKLAANDGAITSPDPQCASTTATGQAASNSLVAPPNRYSPIRLWP